MGPYPTVNYGAGYYPQQLDLAAVMRQVYLWLAMGLTVGFGVAFALGHQLEVAKAVCAPPSCDLAQYSIVFNPAVFIISLIAYFVLGFTLRPIIRRASIPLAATLYIVFTAVFGFMVSSYFAVYDTNTIVAAFGVTAGMFAFMCLLGYTTRADLSKLGAILFMALFGLILASIVNFFFLQNQVLFWVINYAGVVIFCGLTAYDTQAIRKMATAAAASGSPDSTARVALYGAFRLFVDFINLFLFILRILGGRGGSRR